MKMKVCGLSSIGISCCLHEVRTEDLLRNPSSISFQVYISSDSKPGLVPNFTMREKERQQTHTVLWREVLSSLGFQRTESAKQRRQWGQRHLLGSHFSVRIWLGTAPSPAFVETDGNNKENLQAPSFISIPVTLLGSKIIINIKTTFKRCTEKKILSGKLCL